MKNIVFVFGAGASTSEGLPSQSELLKKYFESNSEDSFREVLEGYFKNFYNINFGSGITTAKFPTFEESLGIIELAIDKEESFSPNYTLSKLREIRNALIMSMGITIEKSQLNSNANYIRLTDLLIKKGTKKYSFVSFNYDILLDNALMRLLTEGVYIDYGIKFANEGKELGNFPNWKSPPLEAKSVKYLKPHGSFNWMYCPTCNSMYILGDKKSEVFRTGYSHEIEHCPKDKTELSCVIEPPSFFKKYKNLYLQIIWKEMYNLLSEADTVFFIGYSLPEADMWTKYLLKRSCFHSVKKFIVVNQSEDERAKYERLLGEVEYHKYGFKELVDEYIRRKGTS